MNSLTITCFLMQSVASQMVPQMSYPQMYQPNIPNPMQYFNPQTLLSQNDDPSIRRRSSNKKKNHKKRGKYKNVSNIQKSYSSEECSEDISRTISGSRSQTSSESEECRCSCDQCTQPLQCCVQMCSTCPVPSPGIVFVPYPYPMIITQKTKKKPNEIDKENIPSLRIEKAKEVPKNIPKEYTEHLKYNYKNEKFTLKLTATQPSITTTQAITTESTTTKTTTTEATTTEATTLEATTTEATTTEATTTETTTTEAPSIEVTTSEATTSQSTTTQAIPIEDSDIINIVKRPFRNIEDSFADLYDYPRFEKYVTNSYKDEIDALYSKIGRRYTKFNDAMQQTPKPQKTKKTKYVMASIRNVKPEWFPKYGILPIPDNMARELIMSLSEMKAPKGTKDLRKYKADEFKAAHGAFKRRKTDRFKPSYTEHLYQRHRNPFK